MMLRVLKWMLFGMIIASIFALIFGILVKWLWGFTLSPLFGISTPSYWQAVGLVLLARLIFGGFHHNNHHKRSHFSGKCKNGKREAWLHKFHNRIHNEMPDEDWSESISMSEDLKEHYHDFWKKEGKESFKAYIAALKSDQEKPDDFPEKG